MTRAQFLNDLYRRLHGLTQEQAEQHLTYYAEMLADRMEEGMSEEEAVASMEPLDTIAQRILQDEGNSTVQPPQYPDLPSTDGSRFSKTPDLPKKKGKKLIQALLWAAAIVAVISAVGRWRARHFSSAKESAIYEVEESLPDIDWGTSWEYEEDWEGWEDWSELYDLWKLEIGPHGIYGSSFSIGPDGIFIGSSGREVYIGPNGIQVERLTDEMMSAQYRCADDIYRLEPEEANQVDISWNSGMVSVQGWDETYIQFQEFSDSRLKQPQKLEYSTEGGLLHISDGVSIEKGLMVWAPRDVLQNLYVNTSEADVYVDQVSAEYALLQTVTGGSVLSNSAFMELQVNGNSGNVALRSVSAADVDIDVTSGDIYLDAVAGQLEASSSSGNILGHAAGDSIDLDTSSGNIDIKTGAVHLDLGSTSGKITAAFAENAASSAEIETTSGNVTLQIPEYGGFALEFDSTSGYFDHGPFSVIRSGDQYMAEGDPTFFIEVDTVSGNLQLKQ